MSGPGTAVGRSGARRGIRFRFRADDAEASFECHLDKGTWKRCESPRRVKTGRGRHRFRVRATDPRGNTEPDPAVWRFTVNVPE